MLEKVAADQGIEALMKDMGVQGACGRAAACHCLERSEKQGA